MGLDNIGEVTVSCEGYEEKFNTSCSKDFLGKRFNMIEAGLDQIY